MGGLQHDGTNLAPGFDNKQVHLYVVEVDKCASDGCNVKAADMTPEGAASDRGVRSNRAALSYDGGSVVFTSESPNLGGMKGVTNVFVYDRVANQTRRVTDIQSTYSADPWLTISRSGAYVGFGCQSVLDPRFPDTKGYGGLYALLPDEATLSRGPPTPSRPPRPDRIARELRAGCRRRASGSSDG